jgi:hypothetical protein
MRARGVTLKDLQPRRLNVSETEEDVEILKAGDLGGVLVRVGASICLAVVEPLNFKTSTSKKIVPYINYDKLEDEATVINVQIVGLSPSTQLQDEEDFLWIANDKYLQIQESKYGVISPRHFVLQVPGKRFYLALGAGIVEGRQGSGEFSLAWTVENSHLNDALVISWEFLNPELDQIVENVESLPQIAVGFGLPYLSHDGSPQLKILNPPVNLDTPKLMGNQIVACKLCSTKVLPINEMRNHVGMHIIRALRGSQDGLMIGREVRATLCLAKYHCFNLEIGWV